MKIKNLNMLVLLFSLTYMVSYITRINYGAVVSEIENATGYSKQLLSIALTGSFVTYGVGQIFSGILGDKLSPKKLVMFGLFVTVLMNLLIPFCASAYLLAIVWSINGLAQSFMWPPIVKIMLSLMTKTEYDRAVVKVSWGSSIGTILVYVLSPVIISLSSWKGVFFFSAFMGILMMIAWQSFCPRVNVAVRTEKIGTENSGAKFFTPVFVILAVAIIICGMLRDGVQTWTPSLISESFNLSSGSGILSGALLPVFSMICYEVSSVLYRKKFDNPVTCAGIIFLVGALSSLMLKYTLNVSPALSVISIALLNGTMHGVNLMFTCFLPSYYAGTGKVSTIAGLLNSFVYIGSAVSTYGIAYLTENYGWSFTVMVWLALAVLGMTLCFVFAGINKNKKDEV